MILLPQNKKKITLKTKHEILYVDNYIINTIPF